MRKLLLTLSFVSLSILATSQEVDTIHVGEKFKSYHNLKPGEYKYLVYMEKRELLRPTVLMMSTVSEISNNNEKLLSISHIWRSFDQKMNGNFFSVLRPETLEPVIHIRESNKGKEAYEFHKDSLVGLDSASNNLEAEYSRKLEEPIFNFEIDIETFSCLPLTDNYKAALYFYHPGSTYGGPAWYSIEVERSEELELPGGSKLDTWVLFIDYNGTQPTRFWYTKETQDFVKMEGDYNGTKIVKSRLF